MQEIINQLNWTQLLIFFMTTVGGALVVWYRKKLNEWRQSWADIFNNLRRIPDLENKILAIYKYVSPNGGSSIIDTVNRTEKAICRLDEQLNLLSETVRAHNDSDDEIGRFHTNEKGENIYVNQTYARLLKIGKAELMGWNWLNFIHPEDNNRVKLHWDQCRAEHRQYRMRHRMISSAHEIITVDVTATPIPETGPAKLWVGTIRQVSPPTPLCPYTHTQGDKNVK